MLASRRSTRGQRSESDPVQSPPSQRRRVDQSDLAPLPSSPPTGSQGGESELFSSPPPRNIPGTYLTG